VRYPTGTRILFSGCPQPLRIPARVTEVERPEASLADDSLGFRPPSASARGLPGRERVGDDAARKRPAVRVTTNVDEDRGATSGGPSTGDWSPMEVDLVETAGDDRIVGQMIDAVSIRRRMS
jgi:hypothetical protein